MSSLRPPLEEPLSPELVLVCPELAERARLLLPEPAWVAARFEVRGLAGPVRPAPLQTLVLALACVLMTVTPLVLTLFALSGHTSPVPRTAQVSRPAQVWP